MPLDAEQARRGWWLAYGIIIVLVVLWFSPAWIEGQVLAPFDIVTEMLLPWRGDKTMPQVHNHFTSDAVTQYIPYRMFAARSFLEDGYVGWNPLIFGGVAQYANTMGLYFDWTMQLHRFLRFWTAWHLGLITQFLLAGFGMIFLLKSRGCSPHLACFGSVAYMGNWQFVALVYHRWALGSFCWMPWVLWAMYGWRDRSRFYGPLVPIFIALAYLGGTLQYVAYVVIAIVCVWAGWLWEQHGQINLFKSITGSFFLWGSLSVGLASFMFEPTISAYIQNLHAGHIRGSLGYPEGLFQPFLNLMSYPFSVYPFILGSPQSLDLWKLLKSNLFNVGFFGTLPVLLAVLALFNTNVSKPAKVLIITGLVIPLTPLVGPLYHRVNLLWILGGSWAAAEGLYIISLNS
jgi:hypothetical protein